ncbi:MAG TPA: alpha/beta fold hydrolase [Steroidobacteraceae bacterium]|jgi:pimeloyl-ACP methyl ester carboxylesterase
MTIDARAQALLLWALLCSAIAVASTHESSVAQGSLTVGTLTLQRCTHVEAWCGSIHRALDPTGAVPGALAIHFEYYPHEAAGKAQGLLVATEGGPGFPATDSRDEYLALFRPLLAHRDFLIMDNRGTGQSGAINCTALQSSATISEEDVGACGRSLGRRADLYSTAYAADDLAAILDAFGSGPIDLYGDSYGTYFSQVFAVRHPAKLRSLILDGAYALDGPDYAWYPTYAPAMRDKFNIACRRDPACVQLPGDSLDRIVAALGLLRRAPFKARAPDADGKAQSFTANASALATVMFASAPAFSSVRELDAAARAFVATDQAPLLRLMAETLVGVDSRDATHAPEKFSSGLAVAITCQDEPQIFDMRLAPASRLADRNRVIEQRQLTSPDTYAPFTIAEYRGLPRDYSFIDTCVLWPVAPPAHPAGHVVPETASYPDVPVLVLSGELDNMTTIADGAAAAKRFAHARQLIFANSFHVNALPHARSGCAAQIARRFIVTLQAGDTACTRSVPPVRLLGRFARRSTELTAAHALPGNTATLVQLQAATAALLTAADVMGRLELNTTGEGVGLRGGTFTTKRRAGEAALTLQDVRWCEDLAVSGTLSLPGRSGHVVAELELEGTKELSGKLKISWTEGSAEARAQMLGMLGGAAVRADLRAP